MSRERLIKLREKILDKPFSPKLSEIVDRIDKFLIEEGLLYEGNEKGER